MEYSYFYILKAIFLSSPLLAFLCILPLIIYIFISFIYSLLCIRNGIIFSLCAFIISILLIPVVYFYTFSKLTEKLELDLEYRKTIYQMVLEDKINNNKEILNLVRFSTTDEIIKKYSPNSKFYVSQNRKENKIQKVLSDFSLIPTTTDYFDQLSKKFVSQTSILIKIKPLVAKCIKQEDINLNKKTIYDIKQNIDKKILKCSINSAEQLIK